MNSTTAMRYDFIDMRDWPRDFAITCLNYGTTSTENQIEIYALLATCMTIIGQAFDRIHQAEATRAVTRVLALLHASVSSSHWLIRSEVKRNDSRSAVL